MADIKISNLPTYTAETTGAYLVMNDSGNTTTYKVLKEDIVSQGVHAPLIPRTGSYIDTSILGFSATGTLSQALVADRVVAYPFIPRHSFTGAELALNVNTIASGKNLKIAIYADDNGVPGALIDNSPDLSTTTNGLKTWTYSYTFYAGNVYWLAVHSSS